MRWFLDLFHPIVSRPININLDINLFGRRLTSFSVLGEYSKIFQHLLMT